MTHTLHRVGSVENLKNDWVILCMPSKDINHVGSAPKLKRFFELSERITVSQWETAAAEMSIIRAAAEK